MITLLPSPLDGCQLWRLDLDAPIEAAQRAVLSAAERARAARFVFTHDRQRYEAAHVGLRMLIAQALGQDDPAALAFAEGLHGKPVLSNVRDFHFNLSHSGALGIVAIAAGPVGVDVEVLRAMPDAPALASAHFTLDEARALHARDAGTDRDRAFLEVWTRKEACLKAIGAGLTLDTRTLDVGIGAGRRHVTLATDGAPAQRLSLASGVIDTCAVMAVARVESPVTGTAARHAPRLEICT